MNWLTVILLFILSYTYFNALSVFVVFSISWWIWVILGIFLLFYVLVLLNVIEIKINIK